MSVCPAVCQLASLSVKVNKAILMLKMWRIERFGLDWVHTLINMAMYLACVPEKDQSSSTLHISSTFLFITSVDASTS